MAVLTDTVLTQIAGAENVDKVFCQDGSGVRNTALLTAAIARAEADAKTILLRGWSSAQIDTLLANDPGLIAHVGWIAMAYGAESKESFLADDGSGPYEKQFARAITHLDKLAKSQRQSVGEDAAGQNSMTAGAYKPDMPNGTARFVFAPTKTRPRGGGLF